MPPPAQQAHQQRLGLVVAGMGGEDMGRAACARRLRQRCVTRGARRRRQSGLRLARPASALVRCGTSSAPREPLDVARLPRRLGAQAVVDGDRQQAADRAPTPAASAPQATYSIQGINCDDPACKDLLMDIGTEELSHLEVIGTLARMHLKPMKRTATPPRRTR